jgi:hypothetical protein
LASWRADSADRRHAGARQHVPADMPMGGDDPDRQSGADIRPYTVSDKYPSDPVDTENHLQIISKLTI